MVERPGKSVFFEGVWVVGSVLAAPVSREVRAGFVKKGTADTGLQVPVGLDRQNLFSKVSWESRGGQVLKVPFGRSFLLFVFPALERLGLVSLGH